MDRGCKNIRARRRLAKQRQQIRLTGRSMSRRKPTLAFIFVTLVIDILGHASLIIPIIAEPWCSEFQRWQT